MLGEAERKCNFGLLATRKGPCLAVEGNPEGVEPAHCIRIVPANIGVLPIPEEVADRKVLVKRLVLGQEANVRQTAHGDRLGVAQTSAPFPTSD